jgi:hypothetical protein
VLPDAVEWPGDRIDGASERRLVESIESCYIRMSIW